MPTTLPTVGCTDVEPGQNAQPAAPKGLAFSKVPLPPERPGLDLVDHKPRRVPDAVSLPDLTAIAVPAADLLEQPK